MKRTLVAVVLAVVFVLALAAPAFAITHSATYEMDGVINFKKQAGHWCNTGAEIKQTIMGSGVMDKVQTVAMVSGRITMDDKNDWVAGATPLTVTTVWKLCMPPKAVYEDVNYTDVPIPWQAMYNGLTSAGKVNTGAAFLANPFAPAGGGRLSPQDVIDYIPQTKALTDQIWAVQVQANPGFSGNIHQNGTAAHGNSYNPNVGIVDNYDWSINNRKWSWAWGVDELGNSDRQPGPNYVGNFFTMEQMARTSQGTLKRYIDISSPFNGAYLHEDMSVVGKSQVSEAFGLTNVPAGEDVPGAWWKLF